MMGTVPMMTRDRRQEVAKPMARPVNMATVFWICKPSLETGTPTRSHTDTHTQTTSGRVHGAVEDTLGTAGDWIGSEGRARGQAYLGPVVAWIRDASVASRVVKLPVEFV